MSIYEPPFLISSQPQVVSSGLHIGRFYGGYGAENAPSQEPAPDNSTATLSAIEEYAPTVARLISGLTPEESVEVLQVRIAELKKYETVPLLNIYAKQKIAEYKARLPELKRQAEQARIQRLVTTAGYIVALLALGGLAFYAYSSGYRQIKEAQ